MAQLNTNDEIQCFLGVDANLSQYLDMASHIIDAYLVSKIADANILKDIELNLAAHYYSSVNPELTEVRYDKSVEKYNVPTSEYSSGFGATRWGQMACALDHSGTLKNLHKRKVSVVVV